MNNKLVLGCLGVFFIMSVFVACGEGSIDAFGTDDQVAVLTLESTTIDPAPAITACLADPVCKENYEGTVAPPPSSVQIPSSSSYIPVVQSSSSSLIQLSSGGSSQFPISSSSVIVIVSSQSSGGISGSCAPTPATAELGEQVSWNFVRASTASVTDVISATYDWTFEGASEPTFSGSGASSITKTVSYATSGSHTTTLSINGDTPMTCAPVQINGAPITGCSCVVDNTSPDVANGGVATWTVSGCTTTANISGYSWAGTPATSNSTYAHTFTTKGEAVTPTLSVYNDDNTVQSVVCPAATAIDASKPDYILDGTDAGSYTLEPGTYSMQYACNASQFHQPSINISAFGVWESFNVTYSTSVTPAGSSPLNSQHNIEFGGLFGSWSGSMPEEMISITIDHAAVVKCQ